ncbi:hypothetical protein [Fischerella thermalis]|uniref:hypothetical protein n=1 Tax=Fischerella thermalis TaxID=372787 RepID=UPI00307F6238
MLKIFCTTVRVSPITLAAILGLTYNAFGSEVSEAGAKPKNQIVTSSGQPANYVKENIQNQKPDTQETSVSQQLNTILLLRKTITNINAPTTRTIQKQTVTNQSTTISPPKSIYRQTQESNTLTKVTSISQTPNMEGRSEARYSGKASDLLDNSAPIMPKHNSDVVADPGLQSRNLVAEDEKPQTGESKNKPNKSQYNLFNPTPRELWREFSTDRPDKTETPFTVDAGRFTMEADLFIYTRDVNNKEGDDVTTYNYFVPNFKVGLTNNIDLQIIPEVYTVERTKPKGDRTLSQKLGLTA